MDPVWCYNFLLREQVYRDRVSTSGESNPCIDSDFIDLGPIGEVATACVHYSLRDGKICEQVIVSEAPTSGRFHYIVPRTTSTTRFVEPSYEVIQGTVEYVKQFGMDLAKRALQGGTS
jgi:hypothetical protein